MVSATKSQRCTLWSAISGLLLIGPSGCKPDLVGRPSLIDSPRVIAIRSEAAEAKPADSVTYDVLLASPIDEQSTPRFDWAMCNARRPLAESGPIAESCLQASSPDLTDLGTTSSVAAQIPKDVCQTFGPITPTQKPGEPATRPEDPDTTGGYYQPVRLLTNYTQRDAEYEIGVTRLSCGIALGASQQNTIGFSKQYQANVNPQIQSVTMVASDGSKSEIDLAEGASPLSVHPQENLQFEVQWPTCSSQPGGVACAGAEAYIDYDAVTQALVDRRESIRVSWFATGGNFDHDSTGRSEAEADTPSTSNNWSAPDTTTNVRFWLVIRDDRRGVNWTQFELSVGN